MPIKNALPAKVSFLQVPYNGPENSRILVDIQLDREDK